MISTRYFVRAFFVFQRVRFFYVCTETFANLVLSFTTKHIDEPSWYRTKNLLQLDGYPYGYLHFALDASSRSFCNASCAYAYPALAFAMNAAKPPVGLEGTAGSALGAEPDGLATEGGRENEIGCAVTAGTRVTLRWRTATGLALSLFTRCSSSPLRRSSSFTCEISACKAALAFASSTFASVVFSRAAWSILMVTSARFASVESILLLGGVRCVLFPRRKIPTVPFVSSED